MVETIDIDPVRVDIEGEDPGTPTEEERTEGTRESNRWQIFYSEIGNFINATYGAAEEAALWTWDQMKEHKKALGYLAAAAGVALGVVKAHNWATEPTQVFNSVIGEYRVRYEEDGGLFNEANVMTLQKDGYTYTLIDSWGEHNLDWKSNEPDFGGDSIERVVIRTPLGRVSTIDRSQLKGKNVEADRASLGYENANIIYNEVRGEIRDFLRAQYIKDCEKLRDDFQRLKSR